MPDAEFVGPYHRQESPTQTAEVAAMQAESGEIWGGIPRGGQWPTVQAYPRALEHGARGVQFTTPIAPHPNGAPHEVRWYLGITPGVLERYNDDGDQFACVTATVTNHQR